MEKLVIAAIIIGVLGQLLVITVLFATIVTYNYMRDLHRDLKAAREDGTAAWRLYDTTHRQLCALQGRPAPAQNFADTGENKGGDKSSAPFEPAGIGPTAINDREFRREQREPQRAPTAADVSTAAAEATTNENES
jgi:hypothetical protein